MEEINKKLVKGVIKLEVMRILSARSTNIESIIKKISETLEIGLNTETVTRILDLMEKNGYIRSKVNKTGLRKSYALTLDGKSLFKHTRQSLNFLNTLNLNNEKLAKWISLHFPERNTWINERMIENIIGSYQAEKMLKEYLAKK